MNVRTHPVPQARSGPTSPPSLDRLVDALPVLVLAIDHCGTILYANAIADSALGGGVVDLSMGDVFRDFAPSLVAVGKERDLVLTTTQDDVAYDTRISPLGGGQYAVSLHARSSTAGRSGTAEVDDLTGLAKRNAFMNELTRALVDCRDGSDQFAVHCLDLDRFKMVNDTLGHGVGDLLLQRVSERIKSACRKGDVIARLGGDEFVVLQREVESDADAERLAARLVDLVGRTYVLTGHTMNIGVSIGVALSGDTSQARDMLRNGDLALYEAKRAGRGRYRLFHSEMDALLRERRELEIDLRRALALKQFELHYQPFVDLTTDRVVGFEALLRWNHPTRGNVPPLRFIPLAEETGLIVKIGEWVMRTACMAAASWPEDMIVAVNVSPIQFKADTLLETVSSALERSGLPAGRLEIEITEGALLDDTDNVLVTLNSLRDLGVKISMDDFGTGYSSLSYLQKFPFNKIKIDRSFVAGSNADSEAILKAVAGLGASLGMAITAEGVETKEQLALIRDERCTHAQGYLTGRPMAADRVVPFLTACENTTLERTSR